MQGPIEPIIFWTAIAIQFVGLVSAVAARMWEQTSARVLCQRFFLISLVVVGLATMVAVACDSACWLSCGTTLSIMAVGGTLDLRRTSEAAVI